MGINDILLKAISWTLIHSVWQGFLLAFVAGLVIIMTKKSSSELRYNILAALFVGFLAVVGMTFDYEFQTQNTETVTRLNLPVQDLEFAFGHHNSTLISADQSQILIEFFNRNANLIVLIWFLIFSVRCFGIFGNLSHIYRIRNYKTQLPAEFWQDKISELASRIHLNKTIILLESRLVKVPSVTGFFKPIVLIPLGLLSSLPQDQIEAILLHELAHIRRKDYAINILQSFAEILFFFNPGVLWLSSILRDERENCCDDIAIEATENKSKFIHALVSFEEYNLKKNSLAMGFGRSKNHLLNRAKRILNNNNKTLNSVEKTLLSASLIIIAVVMVACSNGRIGEMLFLKSKSQTEADLLVDQANADADQITATANLQADKFAQDADQNEADRMAAQADIDAVKADTEAAKADAEAAKADAVVTQADYLANQADIQARNADAEARRIEAAKKAQKVQNNKTTTTTTTTINDEPSGKKHSVAHLKTGISGNNLPANIEVDKLTNDIISDLISEKIINTNNNLSYSLSQNQLIVNGVEQPVSILAKLSRKYVKSKDISIVYNYEYSTKVSGQ